MASQSGALLIIGIGNPCRGDDAIGLLVARKLKAELPPKMLEARRVIPCAPDSGRPTGGARGVTRPTGVTIREATGEGTALMEAWRGVSVVILVDAVQSGGKAGTVHRLDAGRHRIPSRFFHCSTHAFSLAEAVELARTLKQLPPRLIVYGVEGRNFTPGKGLSPEVKNALPKVTSQIRGELEVPREPNSLDRRGPRKKW